MKYLITVAIFISSTLAIAQEIDIPESFKHLKPVMVDDEIKAIVFLPQDYSSTFETNDKLLEENYLTTFIGLVKLQQSSKEEYLIGYSPGISVDPHFLIFKKMNDTYKYLFSIYGKQIFVPGNGNIYISGHTNNMFNMKRKFKFKNDTIEEVKQPLFHVGLKTKTLEPITLFADKNLKERVASLPKGSEIEVVASEFADKTSFFLIKTSFGLLGWWKLDNDFHSMAIEKLFYAGD
jgi:hypothetical protein